MARLEIKQGDLLEADERMVVHGCNAKGTMGAGVARAIKVRWPQVYNAYRGRHKAGGLTPGEVIFVEIEDDRVVANAITQRDYGRSRKQRYVSYDAVADCMSEIRDEAIKRNIAEIAMPKIGAGLANGRWDIIERIIESELVAFGISVTVYEL